MLRDTHHVLTKQRKLNCHPTSTNLWATTRTSLWTLTVNQPTDQLHSSLLSIWWWFCPDSSTAPQRRRISTSAVNGLQSIPEACSLCVRLYSLVTAWQKKKISMKRPTAFHKTSSSAWPCCFAHSKTVKKVTPAWLQMKPICRSIRFLPRSPACSPYTLMRLWEAHL